MLGAEEAVVALRLKVEWDEVTEAEWFVARASDPGTMGPLRAGEVFVLPLNNWRYRRWQSR
jgi:hypothetical protein